MTDRIDIGKWKNQFGDVALTLLVDDGQCDICHEYRPVLFMVRPNFVGNVCLKCISDGFELFAIKNKRQMPVLMYKDTLGSTV